MNLDGYRPDMLRAIADRYPRLDAVAASPGTAAGYPRADGAGCARRVHAQSGAVAAGAASGPGSRVVAAAGGLTRRKAFDRLLHAWARLAPRSTRTGGCGSSATARAERRSN